MTIDYFAAYHGKSLCDSWFSILSTVYKIHSMKEENTMITNTDELIQLLKNGLIECNKNSALRKMSKKSKKGRLYFHLISFNISRFR